MNASTMLSGNVATVILIGRFDNSTYRAFTNEVNVALGADAAREVQIDLGSLSYIDSSALGHLLVAREKAQHFGKAISLANATGDVKRVLRVANFQKLFAIK